MKGPLSLTLVLVFGFGSGCKAKPTGEVPTLSGEKKEPTAERDLPGGKTLATALTLLDPRVSDPAQLDTRRADFQQKLTTLIPDAKTRQKLGFDNLLRWHRLFTRRLQQRQRTIEGHRRLLKRVLKPGKGKSVTIDGDGRVRSCENDGPCEMIPGHDQLDSELSTTNDDLRGLIEAQWYLLTHLDRLRARLDPDSVNEPLAAPPGL